jgi:hypothetical protein
LLNWAKEKGANKKVSLIINSTVILVSCTETLIPWIDARIQVQHYEMIKYQLKKNSFCQKELLITLSRITTSSTPTIALTQSICNCNISCGNKLISCKRRSWWWRGFVMVQDGTRMKRWGKFCNSPNDSSIGSFAWNQNLN